MPVEYAPPKYAVVANTIQERIVDGTYAPGSKLPSEAQLTDEFGTSRPIVVRALEILKQDGWIDSHQGKGRFVRAHRAAVGRHVPQYLGDLLEETKAKLVSARAELAPNRAASALGVAPGTPLIARQRLVVADVGPVELSTAYLPVDLASGTDADKEAPIPGGLLAHLTRAKGVIFDHATQRISARHATAAEARLLDVGRREIVLTVLVTVYDREGTALLCVDAALPSSRHEMEDAYPLP